MGRFDYRILARGPDDLVGPAIVQIVPSWWSELPDKTPVLSANLMSDQEIDDYVRSCKEDLDDVGRRAKRALKRTND